MCAEIVAGALALDESHRPLLAGPERMSAGCLLLWAQSHGLPICKPGADPLLAPENHALEVWLERMIKQRQAPHLALELHNDDESVVKTLIGNPVTDMVTVTVE